SGTLRFETGPRRISAEDFEAMKVAVRTFQKRPTVFARFLQAGEAHLAQGRVPEALAEFRRLTALHPQEALHPTQLAMALLGAGLGEGARDAARQAVSVEPSSAVAYRRLGWVLLHYLVGR